MQYLATKNHWHDVYPSDAAHRVSVDQYLHWHHQNTRMLTKVYFRPFLFGLLLKGELPRAFKESEVAHINGALDVLETWLSKTNGFIAGPKYTLADISAYCEFDQLLAITSKLPEVQFIDFSRYPAISKWLKEMQVCGWFFWYYRNIFSWFYINLRNCLSMIRFERHCSKYLR